MEWPAPPAAPLVSCGQVQPSGGVRIMGIAIVGIDLGKNVCSIVEADEVGKVLQDTDITIKLWRLTLSGATRSTRLSVFWQIPP